MTQFDDRLDKVFRPAPPAEATLTSSRSTGDETPPAELGAIAVRLSDVQPEPVRWLWPNRIACGKLTLLVGDPGLGKSFLTLDLAARVSTGTPWPDCLTTANPVGSVILLSAEDDLADTIRPRLDAARADVRRVHAIQAVRRADHSESMFSLESDLHALEKLLVAVGDVRLVIIDPVTAYLGGSDGHNNAELRSLMAPLSAMAAKHRAAVVAVSHLNKAAGVPAIYRAMGSVAFVAAARAAWCVARCKSDPSRRLFLPLKNNVGNDRIGMAFRLVDSVIQWEPDPVTITANDALAPPKPGGEKVRNAESWLAEALARGPLPQTQVVDRAEKDGIKGRTLRRAANALGVVKTKSAFGAGWAWSLPDEDGQLEDGQPPPDSWPPSAGAAENAVFGGSASEGGQSSGYGHLRLEDDPFEAAKRRVGIDPVKARAG